MHVEGVARKTWWDFVTAWLGDRWNQLVDAFAHRVHIGGPGSIVAGDVILILVAAVVVVVLVRLFAGYIRETPAVRGALPFAPPLAAEAIYSQSVQAANRGDYAGAIALLFRAALTALDVRGVVHDEPSRTVNECRREVGRTAPRFAAPFDTIARAFTAAIYAEALVTPAQWTAARDAYGQISMRSDYEP